MIQLSYKSAEDARSVRLRFLFVGCKSIDSLAWHLREKTSMFWDALDATNIKRGRGAAQRTHDCVSYIARACLHYRRMLWGNKLSDAWRRHNISTCSFPERFVLIKG